MASGSLYYLAAFPDLALKHEWWGKRVGTVESWRRHYRTLSRRDDNKPEELLKIKIPLDVILYFSPPGFFISLPHGKFIFESGLNA